MLRRSLLGALAAVALLASSPAEAYRRTFEVVDGDTLRLTGVGKLSGFLLRMKDLDAPETNGKCDYERDLALRATNRLNELTARGVTFVTDLQTDRYGRLLGQVFDRKGQNVALLLIKEGLARPYTGQTQRQPWCP